MKFQMTKEIAREFFDYNQSNGQLFIKKRDRKWFDSSAEQGRFNTRWAEKILKTKDKDGYVIMTISKTRFTAHSIIWIYMTGKPPEHETDHINGIRDDNSWANLRPVTRGENLKNKSVTNRTPCLVLGVSFLPELNKYRARISANGTTTYHLGVFTALWDAICARKSAERKYGYHENHGKALI